MEERNDKVIEVEALLRLIKRLQEINEQFKKDSEITVYQLWKIIKKV